MTSELHPGLRFAVDTDMSKGEMKVFVTLLELERDGKELTTKNLKTILAPMSAQHINSCLQLLQLKNVVKKGEKRGFFIIQYLWC